MFTILGSSGFIGSYLTAAVHERGLEQSRPAYYRPTGHGGIPTGDLGDVICCVGLTADFRTRPFDTVEAHVCYVLNILKHCKFDSFTYLSSTRVYGPRGNNAQEDDIIQVEPLKFDDLYNLSKVMGESICFAVQNAHVRVVRLSNVYGYDYKSANFIFTLIRDALHNRKIVLNTTFDSCKDYINVHDAIDMLLKIATSGRHNLYNVAFGTNITVGQITTRLRELTGCVVDVSDAAQRICFPRIDVSRVCTEFSFQPRNLLDDLAALVYEFKQHDGINWNPWLAGVRSNKEISKK